MKRIIIGIFILALAIGTLFYADRSTFHSIYLYPYDSQQIELSSPINIIYIKNIPHTLNFQIINGSINKEINESNEIIIITTLNSTHGNLILINNSSNLVNIKYNVETLYSSRVILFFGSIIVFIVGTILILTELKGKK
ncbi:hypothetical protein DFR86_01565 [Acidianus sulfidivorans JP7]|uniref:Uncharacterized protein n=1 Tax=Acidianus sulfidivorans JP7 TaxID=619593 RepID=A0A2U9IK15_9CREN|nr:hypothetical protein [Acidianus sulfidivorans]AWR96363.1 hypothetical protein DFR86_01565 [Acidianus sulfidivorans JP7]